MIIFSNKNKGLFDMICSILNPDQDFADTKRFKALIAFVAIGLTAAGARLAYLAYLSLV